MNSGRLNISLLLRLLLADVTAKTCCDWRFQAMVASKGDSTETCSQPSHSAKMKFQPMKPPSGILSGGGYGICSSNDVTRGLNWHESSKQLIGLSYFPQLLIDWSRSYFQGLMLVAGSIRCLNRKFSDCDVTAGGLRHAVTSQELKRWLCIQIR